jgi:type IV secretion system protein TrbL
VAGEAAIVKARLFIWLGCGALLVCVSSAAEAQGFTLFDPIVNNVGSVSQGWFSRIQSLVRPTFLLLAAIEFCWAAAVWAFEKDSLNSLAMEMIKKFMLHGFFFAVLLYAQDWLPAIFDTFKTVGEQAGGEGVTGISTDGIITQGMETIARIWAQFSSFGFISQFALETLDIAGNTAPDYQVAVAFVNGNVNMSVWVSIVVAIAYVVTAAQFFALQVETYVLFAAGAILLALGGSSWTKDWAQKYLNYALNTGVRMLALLLILSLTMQTVARLSSGFHVVLNILSFNFIPLFEIMAAATLQAFLAIKVPELAGALLNGTPGFTMGSFTQTVMQAVSFAAMMNMAKGSALGGSGGGGQQGAAAGRASVEDAAGAAPNMPANQAQDRGAAVAGLARGHQGE